MTGELLQAALGYEATPTAVQLSLYLASILAALGAMALARVSVKTREYRK